MSGKIEAIAAYFCDLDDDSMASLMRAHHGDSAAEWQVMQDALGFGTHGLLACAIGHGVTPADLAHGCVCGKVDGGGRGTPAEGGARHRGGDGPLTRLGESRRASPHPVEPSYTLCRCRRGCRGWGVVSGCRSRRRIMSYESGKLRFDIGRRAGSAPFRPQPARCDATRANGCRLISAIRERDRGREPGESSTPSTPSTQRSVEGVEASPGGRSPRRTCPPNRREHAKEGFVMSLQEQDAGIDYRPPRLARRGATHSWGREGGPVRLASSLEEEGRAASARGTRPGFPRPGHDHARPGRGGGATLPTSWGVSLGVGPFRANSRGIGPRALPLHRLLLDGDRRAELPRTGLAVRRRRPAHRPGGPRPGRRAAGRHGHPAVRGHDRRAVPRPRHEETGRCAVPPRAGTRASGITPTRWCPPFGRSPQQEETRCVDERLARYAHGYRRVPKICTSRPRHAHETPSPA